MVLSHKKALFLLAVVSIATHFAFFGHPREVVFDEVHFGKFISGYFTREYFFDIHPPLGKLLIFAAGKVGGFQPGFSFAEIGQKFPDNAYLYLRLLPTIAGILLPLVLYGLAIRLGFSRGATLTLGLLVIFENSLLVESRLILLNPFLLVFGFLSLYLYLSYRHTQRLWQFLLAGLTAGLAASVKWTGIAFLGIIGIVELINLLKQFSTKGILTSIRRAIWPGIGLIVLPAMVYVSFFIIHLSILTKSGPGDAFMTPEFRKTLAGSTDHDRSDIQGKNMWQKIIELNKEMYTANKTLTATHPYSSKWYSWPFMERPIYYWYGKDATTNLESRIYFIGNPIIWWLSTLAILYLIIDAIATLYTRQKMSFVQLLLIGGFIVNMLPFIGISRAMFLYHYLTGYIFALIGLVYLIDQIKHKKAVLIGVTALSLAVFIFFAPLTYGLPLSVRGYAARVWLPSWK